MGRINVVDPNKNGPVVLEDLIMYARLVSRPKSRNILLNNEDDTKSLTVNFLRNVEFTHPLDNGKPRELGTDWTNIGGNSSDSLGNDNETFGMTNIQIDISANGIPQVTIDFVDIRGDALLGQGNCSPYSVFFNMPYPIFDLTIKGYYGKAVTYPLHLRKFNVKFNSTTGNFEAKGEFIGWSYAFLADMIMGYAMAAPYMFESQGGDSSGKGILKKIYGSNTELLTDTGEPLTIIDLMRKSNELKTVLSQFKATDDYKNTIIYRDLKDKLNNILTEVNLIVNSTKVDDGEYTFQGQFKLEPGEDRLSTDTGNYKGKLLVPSSASTQLIFQKVVTNVGIGLDPTDSGRNLLTYYDEYKNLLDSLNTDVKNGLELSPVRGWYTKETNNGNNRYYLSGSYIDFSPIVKDVRTVLNYIKEKETEGLKNINESLNSVVKQQLGFNPTIRNIMLVLTANVQVFIELLIKYSTEAQTYHDSEDISKYVNSIMDLSTQSLGPQNTTNNTTDSKKTLYPWPTVYDMKTKEGDCVGDGGIIEKVERYPSSVINPEATKWSEIVFTENFKLALINIKKQLNKLGSERDVVGFNNFIPITPLETQIVSDTTTNGFYEKGLDEIYKTISDRMFLSTSYSYLSAVDYFQLSGRTDTQIELIGAWKSKNELYGKLDALNFLNSLESESGLKILNSITNDVKSFQNLLNKIKPYSQQAVAGSSLIWSHTENEIKISNSTVNVNEFDDLYITEKDKFNSYKVIVNDSYLEKFSKDQLPTFITENVSKDKNSLLRLFYNGTSGDDELRLDSNLKLPRWFSNGEDGTISEKAEGAFFTTKFQNELLSFLDFFDLLGDTVNKYREKILSEKFDGKSQIILDGTNEQKLFKIIIRILPLIILDGQSQKGLDIFKTIASCINIPRGWVITVGGLLWSLDKEVGSKLPQTLKDILLKIPEQARESFKTQFSNYAGSTTLFSDITSKSVFKTDEETPYIVDFSKNNPNTFSNLFLKDFVVVTNPTPKNWISSDVNFLKMKLTQLEAEYYASGFYNILGDKQIISSIRTKISDEQKKLERSVLGEDPLSDDDVMLSLYRSFKSIFDKWIPMSSDGKYFFNLGGNDNVDRNNARTLSDHFFYVNRFLGDIGDKAVVDITYLEKLVDNPNQSFYQFIGDFLHDNNFTFFPMTTYVNFHDPESAQEMFKPITNTNGSKEGPAFICVYSAGSSRNLKLKDTDNCYSYNQYNDDGLDFSEVENGSICDTDNNINIGVNDDKYNDSNNLTAFKVQFSKQDQSYFNSFELDQSEFKETQESLKVIDSLAKSGGVTPTARGSKPGNLYDTYLTRSYTCTVGGLGNMTIQPLQYFLLESIPLFNGTYWIFKVSHNITPNHVKTNFTGTRQPRVTIPIIEDISLAMLNTLSEIEASTDKSLDLSKVHSGGKIITSSNEWRSTVNRGAKDFGSIKSTSTENDVIVKIQTTVEGGYYHPVMWYTNPKKFSVYSRSGETMLGEDRAAGQTEQYPSGVEFWKIIDENSGYGNYGTLSPTLPEKNNTSKNNYSRRNRTDQWDSSYLESLKNKDKDGFGFNQFGGKNSEKLKELSRKISSERLDSYFKSYFKGNDNLVKLIKTDGRLLFLYYRASFNGPGYFKVFAKNLITVYNSGVTNVDKLIESELDFRWGYAKTLNPNSRVLIEQDVTVASRIIGITN